MKEAFVVTKTHYSLCGLSNVRRVKGIGSVLSSSSFDSSPGGAAKDFRL